MQDVRENVHIARYPAVACMVLRCGLRAEHEKATGQQCEQRAGAAPLLNRVPEGVAEGGGSSLIEAGAWSCCRDATRPPPAPPRAS